MSFTINGTTGINLGTQPLTGSLPDTNAPSGSVIQVVQGSTTSATTTSSTSFVDTNLSASITPASASNKILILVSGPLYGGNTGYNFYASAALLRSSTALIYTTHIGDNQAGSGVGVTVAASLNMQYLDSPATTSSTTYKIQIRSQQSSYSPSISFPFQSGMQTATATITLMEIAA